MQSDKIDLEELLAIKDPDAMITTTKGMMRVGDLDRSVIEFEDDHELTYVIEYRKDKELVHRSAHVQLKYGNSAESETSSF